MLASKNIVMAFFRHTQFIPLIFGRFWIRIKNGREWCCEEICRLGEDEFYCIYCIIAHWNILNKI